MATADIPSRGIFYTSLWRFKCISQLTLWKIVFISSLECFFTFSLLRCHYSIFLQRVFSEIPRQCSRVIIPPEGIRQDFPLEGNIYKFYNPFERLTVFFFLPCGDTSTNLSHYA